MWGNAEALKLKIFVPFDVSRLNFAVFQCKRNRVAYRMPESFFRYSNYTVKEKYREKARKANERTKKEVEKDIKWHENEISLPLCYESLLLWNYSILRDFQFQFKWKKNIFLVRPVGGLFLWFRALLIFFLRSHLGMKSSGDRWWIQRWVSSSPSHPTEEEEENIKRPILIGRLWNITRIIELKCSLLHPGLMSNWQLM